MRQARAPQRGRMPWPARSAQTACAVFRGFLPQSFSDYTGHIAAVLFTGGCNFRCRFCYNAPLVLEHDKLPALPAHQALEELRRRAGFIDTVVVSGGEPTLHSWLPDFLRELRGLPLRVGLDTNGSNPQALAVVIEENLADRIAMDLKAPFHKYEAVTGAKGVEQLVARSLRLVVKTEHEIRITLHPSLHSEEDVRAMGSLLAQVGARKVALQSFKPWKVLDPTLERGPSYSRSELERFARWFPGTVIIR